MKKFLLLVSLLLITSFAYAEAVQIDFLLAGMRDPLTDLPLSGGKVYTYTAGTSTPLNLYIDRDETGYASNPVDLDAYGRAIVFGNSIYRFIVKNASGSIVWSSDGLEYQAQTVTTGLGPLTEDLNAAGFNITNLNAPTDVGDATNKTYVDAKDAILQGNIDDVQTNLDDQTFLDLTDTPLSYSGASDYIVQVGSGALIFTEFDSLIPTASFTELGDTPSSYVGEAGNAAIVNPTEDGLIFAPFGEVPVGTVCMYAGDSTNLPSNWVVCDGTEYNSTTYATLTAAIGGVWGTGLGTIKVPDLRGMFVKGPGSNDQPGFLNAAGAAYNGGTLGDYNNDSFQGHDHNAGIFWGAGTLGSGGGGSANLVVTQGPVDDYAGIYGTARPAVVTEPPSASLYYIIRIE